MTRNPFQRPTDAELEILQILWEYGPSSVRFVNDELIKRREVVYTTTLKLLQIMFEKGLVKRDDSNRTHVYAALIKESDTQQRMLDQLVDTAFRGSAMKLVMQAIGNKPVSKAELDEIKALIEKIEQKQ
jgi:predicted transcriptional regulator